MKAPNQQVWDILEGGMFHIQLNANDFFGYACAYAVELCPVDFRWVLPIIEEFGSDGFNACMSYIEDCNPILEHITPAYIMALDRITGQQPLIYSKIEEWPREFLHKVMEEKITKASREEQKGRK